MVMVRSVVVLTLLILIGVLWRATVTSIVPPESPENSVTVCIVDYGRHASLVLPDNGAAVEFEYGEWNWFALGQTGLPHLPRVLFWPTQGTIGRRDVDYAPDPERLKHDRTAEHIFSFHAASNNVAQLRQRLKDRYNARLHTEVLNKQYNMRFVQDPTEYTAFHNCNHELANWLNELGCDVRGTAMFARFRLLEGRTPPQNSEH